MPRWMTLCLLLAGCPDPTPVDTADTADTADTDVALVDADRDGSPADEDCDDQDPDRFPGADERCNGIDDDCDSVVDEDAIDGTVWYYDADQDGHGSSEHEAIACETPAGFVASSDDCDDEDSRVYPGADEVCGDGVDNDCVPEENDCELRGSITGTFQTLVAGSATESTHFLDVDVDGHLDVLVTDAGVISLRLGPASDLGAPIWERPGFVRSIGDLDGDGFTDAIVFSGIGHPQVVWGPLGVPEPSASSPLPAEWLALTSLDADGDGQQDLAAAVSGEDGVAVWHGPIPRTALERTPDVRIPGAVASWRRLHDVHGGPGDELVVGADLGGGLMEVMVSLDEPVVDVEADGLVLGRTMWSIDDLDGDGRADLCVYDGFHARYYRGPWVVGELPTTLMVEPRQSCIFPVAHDVDGDGLRDLIVGGSFGPRAFLAPFSGEAPDASPEITVMAFIATGAVAFEDVDGDGREDWLIPATPADDETRSIGVFLLDGRGK